MIAFQEWVFLCPTISDFNSMSNNSKVLYINAMHSSFLNDKHQKEMTEFNSASFPCLDDWKPEEAPAQGEENLRLTHTELWMKLLIYPSFGSHI